MRTAVIFCVALVALFALSTAIDVEVTIHNVEVSSNKPFKCYDTANKFMDSFDFKRPYVRVSTLGYDNKDKEITKGEYKSHKNTEVCAWKGNTCTWATPFRLRLRDIKGKNEHNPFLFIHFVTARRDLMMGLMPMGDTHEILNLPYDSTEFYFKDFVGKGKVTKELPFHSGIFDKKRCHAPKAKVTFEVKLAPPLKK